MLKPFGVLEFVIATGILLLMAAIAKLPVFLKKLGRTLGGFKNSVASRDRDERYNVVVSHYPKGQSTNGIVKQ